MDSKVNKIQLIANKLLLTNLLKFADLSQSQCSLTLSHHKNSLVGYVYRYDKKIFPRSFSYFFLLSIYRALAKKHNPKQKISRFDLFYNMILEHGGVVQKLLIPALEHHILSISSLSRGIKFGSGENITKNKDDIFDQDETVIMDKYISVIELEKYENYSLSKNFNPGSDKAPVSGYFSNVDLETNMRNQHFALQHGASQGTYVPTSASELYNVRVPFSVGEPQPHPDLFQKQQFANEIHPNLMHTNIGNDRFFNHTRTQLRNM